MTRRHPVDTAILTGLIVGHITGAIIIARTAHALVQWSRRNEL